MNHALLGLQTYGWCIIENVIPEKCVATVRAHVLETVEQHGRREPGEKGIGFVPGLISVDQSFAPYLAEPRLLGLAEEVLGPHVRVSFTSAIVNRTGNPRGGWHADWPFNQRNAGHVPAPYPDAVMHLTTLWMLSPFDANNGGTLILPGSHRVNNNPTGDNGIDPMEVLPGEVHATGKAGSVLVMDSRLWHASAPNRSAEPRVALAVRYAPWWLNVEVLRPGSVERNRMGDETGGRENEVPSVPQAVYRGLPEPVRPLFRHWVDAG